MKSFSVSLKYCFRSDNSALSATDSRNCESSTQANVYCRRLTHFFWHSNTASWWRVRDLDLHSGASGKTTEIWK